MVAATIASKLGINREVVRRYRLGKTGHFDRRL
jgi:hypothetical protein